MFDRFVEDGVPPDSAFGIRHQRIGSDAGQGPVELAALLLIIAINDQLHVDGQVTPLRPALPFCQQDPTPREYEGIARRIVLGEHQGEQLGHRADGMPVITVDHHGLRK